MSDYVVHGKKGNGKSLVVVGRIRDALLAGKAVATNLNLNLEALLPQTYKTVRCYRLPDRPSIDDLQAIGFGSDQVDESTYGLVVLDECATMLNARSFNDAGRKQMLDWFVHSRKLGWDTYFICQNPVQIDKQVRESLVELSVSCKRMDKLRIPFLGAISKNLIGYEIRPPKLHVATVRYGTGHDAIVSDRWVYTGRDLYDGYDTRQVFKDDYEDGLFSYLSPWHCSAKFAPPPAGFVGPVRPGPIDHVCVNLRGKSKSRNKHMTKYLMIVLCMGLLMGAGGYKYLAPQPVALAAVTGPKVAGVVGADGRVFSETVQGRGYFMQNGVVHVILSDGRTVQAPNFKGDASGYEAEIETNLWVKGVL